MFGIYTQHSLLKVIFHLLLLLAIILYFFSNLLEKSLFTVFKPIKTAFIVINIFCNFIILLNDTVSKLSRFNEIEKS